MTKFDKLQALVNEAYGQEAIILNSNENTVLIKYMKGGEYWEYVTARYNEYGLYSGNYYPCKYSDPAVVSKQAKQNYFERTK